MENNTSPNFEMSSEGPTSTNGQPLEVIGRYLTQEDEITALKSLSDSLHNMDTLPNAQHILVAIKGILSHPAIQGLRGLFQLVEEVNSHLTELLSIRSQMASARTHKSDAEENGDLLRLAAVEQALVVLYTDLLNRVQRAVAEAESAMQNANTTCNKADSVYDSLCSIAADLRRRQWQAEEARRQRQQNVMACNARITNGQQRILELQRLLDQAKEELIQHERQLQDAEQEANVSKKDESEHLVCVQGVESTMKVLEYLNRRRSGAQRQLSHVQQQALAAQREAESDCLVFFRQAVVDYEGRDRYYKLEADRAWRARDARRHGEVIEAGNTVEQTLALCRTALGQLQAAGIDGNHPHSPHAAQSIPIEVEETLHFISRSSPTNNIWSPEDRSPKLSARGPGPQGGTPTQTSTTTYTRRSRSPNHM